MIFCNAVQTLFVVYELLIIENIYLNGIKQTKGFNYLTIKMSVSFTKTRANFNPRDHFKFWNISPLNSNSMIVQNEY